VWKSLKILKGEGEGEGLDIRLVFVVVEGTRCGALGGILSQLVVV